jgi:hypothetical protein
VRLLNAALNELDGLARPDAFEAATASLSLDDLDETARRAMVRKVAAQMIAFPAQQLVPQHYKGLILLNVRLLSKFDRRFTELDNDAGFEFVRQLIRQAQGEFGHKIAAGLLAAAMALKVVAFDVAAKPRQTEAQARRDVAKMFDNAARAYAAQRRQLEKAPGDMETER